MSCFILDFLVFIRFVDLSIEWQTNWRKMMMTAKICLKRRFLLREEIVVTCDAFCHRRLTKYIEVYIYTTRCNIWQTTVLSHSLSTMESYIEEQTPRRLCQFKKKDDNQNPPKSIRDFNHLNWWRTVRKPMIEEALCCQKIRCHIRRPLKESLLYIFMYYDDMTKLSNFPKKLYKF